MKKIFKSNTGDTAFYKNGSEFNSDGSVTDAAGNNIGYESDNSFLDSCGNSVFEW